MKCSDVPSGGVFDYSILDHPCRFIKLNRWGNFNVVNTATWTAAYVNPDAEVSFIGTIRELIQKENNAV